MGQFWAPAEQGTSRRLLAAAIGLVVASAMFFGVSAVAGAATNTFTSAQVGTSGETSQFSESGNWQMAWNYNCANFGQNGNFWVSCCFRGSGRSD